MNTRYLLAASVLALSIASAPAFASPSTYGSNSYSNSNSTAASYNSGSYNWAGPYAGLHVGAMWGDFSGSSASYVGPSGSAASLMGGVQAGYNWQFDRWVVGGEADFSITPIESGGFGGKFEENWTSTLRARAGYAFNNILPYATFGLGLTNTDSEVGSSINNTHSGYAIGAGADYAVMDNLSWRMEYLRVDVPEESDTINGTAFKGGSGNNILRIGANYRFH